MRPPLRKNLRASWRAPLVFLSSIELRPKGAPFDEAIEELRSGGWFVF